MLFYTGFYLIVFFVADLALGGFLHLVLTRNEVGTRTDPIVALRKAQAEVVVIGNSRARYHYDTAVLQDILGRTVFNAGYDGQTLFYYLATLDLTLSSYRPYLVVVDIYPDLLITPYNSVDAMMVLAPHLNESAVLQAGRNSIWRDSPAECAGLFLRSPRYRRIAVELIGNSMFANGRNVGFHPLGSRTTIERLNAQAASEKFRSAKLDRQAIKCMKDMIVLARGAGCKIIFSTSPQWYLNGTHDPETAKLLQELREFFRKEQVMYVEATQQTISFFRDPKLYMDNSHLNALGARVFTVVLGRTLAEQGLGRKGSPPLINPVADGRN